MQPVPPLAMLPQAWSNVTDVATSGHATSTSAWYQQPAPVTGTSNQDPHPVPASSGPQPALAPGESNQCQPAPSTNNEDQRPVPATSTSEQYKSPVPATSNQCHQQVPATSTRPKTLGRILLASQIKQPASPNYHFGSTSNQYTPASDQVQNQAGIEVRTPCQKLSNACSYSYHMQQAPAQNSD